MKLHALLLLLPLTMMAADPPAIINHQGRISIADENYEGLGYFKFAFVNEAGNTTYWSNDGTSTNGGEPTAAVETNIAIGHYGIGLGDASLANMTAIPTTVFSDNDDVHLRVWFGSLATGPFQLLSPDRRITSAGYALSAGEAQGVPDNAITDNMLADGAVTAAKLGAGSVDTTALAPGSVDSTILAPGAAGTNLDEAGSLGIGLSGSDPDAAVDLDGDVGFIAPGLLAEIKAGIGGFNELYGAQSVHVSGTTAFVASYLADSLTIIDVSNPASPTLLAEIKDGIGGFNELNGVQSVHVSGTTAYVASYDDDSLTIIDVSNPSSPTLKAEIKDGIGGFNELDGAQSVHVSGTTAYVASALDDALTIIDVSNPASPILLAEIKDNIGGFNELDGALSVHVSGTTAYVASYTADSLTIIDVSNPASPTLLAEIKDNIGGFNELEGAWWVDVSGTTAYVASLFDDSLTIIDVTNPSSPTLKAEIKDNIGGFNELDGAQSVHVSGTTAYVASIAAGSLTIIDVSNPASPTLKAEIKDGIGGFNELAGAKSVHVSGTTAYVASRFDNSLTVIDVGQIQKVDLATANRVGIGTTTPDAMLHVEGDAHVSGNLIDGNFSAGTAGQLLSSTGSGTSWIDASILNDWNSIGNIPAGFSDNIDHVDDADASPTNEIQDLSLSSDTLSISGGGSSADLSQYLMDDGSEDFTGQLNVVGGKVRIDNEQSYAALDSSGTLREMLKKTSNDETSIATAQNENIIFRDGSNTNMAMTGDNGYFGVGDLDPLARLHVRNVDTGYSGVNDAEIYVEDADAGIFLLSTEGGQTGSSISLVEVDSGTGSLTDRWTIARETTDGGSAGSMRFNFNDGTTLTAAELAANGDLTIAGTYFPTSDKEAKEDFEDIDPTDILDKVLEMPVTRWSYKASPETEHIGPVAQDFHAAFQVGIDDKHISTTDADGVALAAIQGLNKKVEAENGILRQENAELRERLQKLESVVEELAHRERSVTP